jgi:hypothetical protein
MESSGTTPIGGQSPAAIPDIAACFDGRGPFVTVYLGTEAAIEQAAQKSGLRWKSLRRRLEENGAPAEALAAIDPLVPDAHRLGRTLAVVADDSGLRLVRHEPDPPARDAGWVAPLPRVGPFIEWAQSVVPHIVVLADRAGADIVVFTRRADSIVTVGEDSSDDPDLRKSNPGGWSQRRYQQRAENLWERNARAVADEVAARADEVGARLVVVAGDVRALALLREHLPERTVDLLQEVDGSRAPGSGLDEIADDVVKLAATVVAEDTVEVLRKFKEERARRERHLAVEGVKNTIDALAAARVDTLLVHDDPDDDRIAWFDPNSATVAQTRKALTEIGVAEPQKGRLVDVAIRAAFATGAAVRIVPSLRSVKAGIGAIQRF